MKSISSYLELINKKKERVYYKRELLLEKFSIDLNFCFSDLQFPTIRRVHANLFSNDLISVQPLSAPTGTLFYMDYNFEPENVFKKKLIIEKK